MMALLKRAALVAVVVALVAGVIWLLIPRPGRVVPVEIAQESPSGNQASAPIEATQPSNSAPTEPKLKDITRDSALIERRQGLDDPRRDQSMPRQLLPKTADESDDLAESPTGLGGTTKGTRHRNRRIEPPAEASPAQHWLKAHQDREGYFSVSLTPPEDQPGVPSVFCTALAMLANVHVGATHKDGPTRAMVRQAVLWSRKIQGNDGSLHWQEPTDTLLHHAAAAFAIVETHRVSNDIVLKPIADKAIEYLLKSRSSSGAWGMEPQAAYPNVLVTGWALLALNAAELAELSFDKQVFADVALWAWSLRRGGKTAWSSGSDHADVTPVEDSLLADAVFVLALHLGDYVTSGDPTVDAVIGRLTAHEPDWNGATNDVMSWYFTSHALRTAGPTDENEWHARVLEQLEQAALNETEDDIVVRKSWPGTDYWSKRFGPVYTTSLASILEVHCNDPAQE